jgi:hypothetical protein
LSKTCFGLPKKQRLNAAAGLFFKGNFFEKLFGLDFVSKYSLSKTPLAVFNNPALQAFAELQTKLLHNTSDTDQSEVLVSSADL